MKKYNFFYDESEHSRKITKNTIFADNFCDYFIASIIGCKEKDFNRISQLYMNLESKYKGIYTVTGELKSTVIKFKKYKYGFFSFKNNDLNLINDIFDFIINNNIYLYYFVANKIEYIVNQLLINYINTPIINVDAIKYSITKALNLYRPDDVLNSIFDNDGLFVVKLIDFFNSKINENKNNAVKVHENNAFYQIIECLNSYNTKINYNWNYFFSFDYFTNFVYELNIDKYNLYIDKEGSGNTLKSAKAANIVNSYEIDSKDSPLIRLADFMAGILSSFIKGFINGFSYDEQEDKPNFKLLKSNWFKIDKTKFNLYKKFYNVIFENNDCYHEIVSGRFADGLIEVLSFLTYINLYDTFEEYKKIDVKTHQLKYNSACIDYNIKVNKDLNFKG